VLKAVENNTLNDIDFIELNACTSGCVGGIMNIENPFVAKARLRTLRRKLPNKCNYLQDEGKGLEYYMWERSPDSVDVYKLDEDRGSALNKLIAIESILETLPLIDCGQCGAPSCRAFSEDLVNGLIPPDTKCPRRQEENK
jgi:hypothetical protein